MSGTFYSLLLAASFTVMCSVSTVSAQDATNTDNSKDASWAENVDAAQFKEQQPEGEAKSLDELKAIAKNIQALKVDVIELNKDLRKMEEKLLFPSNTRFSIFVSLTTGQFFTFESVKLKLDDKLVATHIYSDKQRQALARGGIHKLYVTNLNEGLHTVTAFFTGIGDDGRPYKRAANLEFEKSIGSEFLELAIMDDGATQEPVFELKRW
ncbi:AraC family transcriptional regulator [Teredinibacter franksiae]|uniref:AraC family transcriptional regulator n=1 Tax=Teredinibacter franksiae TaxID=2761453 RepID=UPI001FE80527|nr:AraC family transcriptional regulator [Teredinibacter franksiae]